MKFACLFSCLLAFTIVPSASACDGVGGYAPVHYAPVHYAPVQHFSAPAFHAQPPRPIESLRALPLPPQVAPPTAMAPQASFSSAPLVRTRVLSASNPTSGLQIQNAPTVTGDTAPPLPVPVAPVASAIDLADN